MARVLTPEQFRGCPTGTVFAFGQRWAFETGMLILDEILGPFENGSWGFYATDPMWVESEDSGDALAKLDAMFGAGASHPCETSSTKYMSYDGDAMDVFLVLDAEDWRRLTEMVSFQHDDTGEGQSDG